MKLHLIDNLTFDYDTSDYPDFADASITSADYDGHPMDEYQLDTLNEDRDFVHEKLMEHIF